MTCNICPPTLDLSGGYSLLRVHREDILWNAVFVTSWTQATLTFIQKFKLSLHLELKQLLHLYKSLNYPKAIHLANCFQSSVEYWGKSFIFSLTLYVSSPSLILTSLTLPTSITRIEMISQWRNPLILTCNRITGLLSLSRRSHSLYLILWPIVFYRDLQ